jgi:lipoate-protein ligase A
MLRVLIDAEPRSGAWNMAVDEALLESALERGVCTLRWYRWIEPTVSLGYFQKPAEIAADPLLAGLPWVKRLSGGGAILHHHEWTYSITLPPGHPHARRHIELYEKVHAPIVSWLSSHGIPARLRREPGDDAESQGAAGGRTEPFLCFGRGDPRDIVLFGRKILGSAQRRRRGAILQHGSLLVRRSPYAPQYSGLEELAGKSTAGNELPHSLVTQLAPVLGAESYAGTLDPAEIDLVNSWMITRYSMNSELPD